MNNDPSSLIPELGDVVTFVSDAYKSTTGKIVYRDEGSIHIHRYNGSTKPVIFTLDSETGLFIDTLGVTEVQIHKKRRDPHFSVQLGTVIGEALDLYNMEGAPIAGGGVVSEIIASDDADAIVLENGAVLDFGFIGTPAGVGVIIPRAAPEAVSNEEAAPASEEAPLPEAFPGFDELALPAALIEEVPSEERTYSDTIQRADMFTSLFLDVPLSRQKDPRVMANLYRVSDVLLAIKNSVVVRDAAGAIKADERRSYIVDNLEDAVSAGAPIAAVMPVAAIKKVVYTDDEADVGDHGDVQSRNDRGAIAAAAGVVGEYENSTGGVPFASYIHKLMDTFTAYTSTDTSSRIAMDQDVLRSQVPPTGVDGFPYDTVPRAEKDSELRTSFLGKIDDRVIRLVGASRIVDPKTGTSVTVASADSAATVGHVVLSADVAARRAPTRSGVLLWDIQASEFGRAATKTFYRALMDNYDDAGLQTSIADELRKRVRPAVSLMQRGIAGAYDALGLRNLEFTQPQFDAITDALVVAQNAWTAAYGALRQRALTALARGGAPPIAGVVDESSPLMAAATLGDADLTLVAESVREKETLFETYDLVYANDFATVAGATVAPLWYKLAAGLPIEDTVGARRNYLLEAQRIRRVTDANRDAAAAFSAAPEINPCSHVQALEKIMSIRDDEKRMLMLQKAISRYNAGQRGNYLLCGECGADLICKHELLLLNEFLHPGRGAALHKSLLLEYGNGVFEGKYICKNCGQTIGELEYDTHLEFDDEGRPLVGRAVVSSESDDAADVTVAIAAEVESEIPFTEKIEKELYKRAKLLFERIGLNATEEMYKRVVPAARAFINERIIPADAYNAARKRAEAEAAAGKKVVVPVEYKYYFANLEVGILATLVLLELQTTDLKIPIPLAGTEFSTAGFPRDGLNPSTAGTGALNYVSFALAGVAIDVAPWNATTWSPLPKAADRLNQARGALLSALFILLALPAGAGKPAPPPLGTFTDVYKARLETAARALAAAGAGDGAAPLASAGDKLPPVFRPLPVAPAARTAGALGNRATFEANVAAGDIAVVGPVVAERAAALAQTVVGALHDAARASGVVVPNNPRSDSSCCYARLGAVALRGFGARGVALDDAARAEVAAHETASRTIAARDPASAAAGTHVYVPWNAPYRDTVLPTPAPEDYYKLFLKNCYAGRRHGLPHELGPDGSCRNCGFEYPAELLYPIAVDISSDLSAKARDAKLADLAASRAEIARAALEAHVTINEDSFMALENRVRAQRLVPPTTPYIAPPFIIQLENLARALPADDAAAQSWTLYIDALRIISTENITDTIERATTLTPFTRAFDAARAVLSARLTALVDRRTQPYVAQALAALDRISGGVDGAYNVRDMFVVRAMQIATESETPVLKIRNIIPSISRSHMELLEKIWASVATVPARATAALQELEAPQIATIKTALERFSLWLGDWTHAWIAELRAGADVRADELTLALRWALVTGLNMLITSDSVLLADAPGPDEREAATRFNARWIVDAAIAGDEYIGKYQLNAAQIEEALNVRAEKERAAFTKILDGVDQDMRKLELMKKKLKIGDWAVGTAKNLFSYDADFYEFQRDQRARFGVPEFDGAITGLPVAATDGAAVPQIDVERDNLHYANDGEET